MVHPAVFPIQRAHDIALPSQGRTVMTPDLTTHYLGLQLANPLVVAACPLTAELDVLKRLADLGAAAAVLPSLFAEQIEAPNTIGTTVRATAGWHERFKYYRELFKNGRAEW